MGGDTTTTSRLNIDGISGAIKEEEDTRREGLRSMMVVVGVISLWLTDFDTGTLELVGLEIGRSVLKSDKC